MAERTVRKYKSVINAENLKILNDRFECELVYEVEEMIKVFNENIKLLKNIRDSDSETTIKMNAMKQLQETQIDKIRALRDSSSFLDRGNDEPCALKFHHMKDDLNHL